MYAVLNSTYTKYVYVVVVVDDDDDDVDDDDVDDDDDDNDDDDDVCGIYCGISHILCNYRCIFTCIRPLMIC